VWHLGSIVHVFGTVLLGVPQDNQTSVVADQQLNTNQQPSTLGLKKQQQQQQQQRPFNGL